MQLVGWLTYFLLLVTLLIKNGNTNLKTYLKLHLSVILINKKSN